ncbi:MAG: 50S ribosomal protein L18 [Gallionella sp.]|nr:50S ribosomal protein L18 [Gallionella sp.]PIR09413.1 MAG: 50S ribosomal protein L18 [Gallionellaceae bacterium CG11_big_fil_rev_8_21_14_0_20_60_62]PIV48308.1 MAG: 50S ribosomal protein L18 [Gallionellaceae bacterium CG02_land_8_20_14_3_00_60_115]PIY06967.1 MAG: 50S ribosomal protein L18 [Gallionellaceae bacterium CG_4_10_14_3_um_filter_60_1069]PJC04638.1 MAG: 50S ribosomal protein L18 [Gallionellaceae bacterium CG_4_9_14_0_8_um_filter_60_335]
MNKNQARQRRGRKTRARIAQQKTIRLAIHRTNLHIYAQIISADGSSVLASASTLEAEVRKNIGNGGNVAAATLVGQRIAEKAKSAGVTAVAFDRSGNKYHGRIKALADAAREHGLQF